MSSLIDIAFPYRRRRSYGAASFAFTFLVLLFEVELLAIATPTNARSSTSKSSTRNVNANEAAPYERLRRYGNAISMRLLTTAAILEERCRPLGSNPDHSDRRPGSRRCDRGR